MRKRLRKSRCPTTNRGFARKRRARSRTRTFSPSLSKIKRRSFDALPAKLLDNRTEPSLVFFRYVFPAAFPVVRSELAVFLGDGSVLEDRLVEVDEEWEKGVASIRKRIELDEIDGKEALRSATKLANRIRRGFVAWLGEN